MEAVQVQQVIARDGEILVTGLPYKRGQVVEIIVIPQPIPPQPSARLTVGRLRRSRLIGLWQDRDDIGDSSVYGPIPLGMCVRAFVDRAGWSRDGSLVAKLRGNRGGVASATCPRAYPCVQT